MTKILLLAAGGAVGTLLRYSLSGLTYKLFNGVFPWGTLFVNLAGSFAIGLLWGFFDIENISSNIRNFIFIGVLGGFTTFSTFALENFSMFRDGQIKLALSNILASNIIGIALVFAGFLLSKYIINAIR
ncbi:MAG: fluoride efflux transporter CrcB [Nitrospirota bacterium]